MKSALTSIHSALTPKALQHRFAAKSPPGIFAFCMGAAIVLSASAANLSAQSATRTLPANYTPGEPLQVSVAVDSAGTGGWTFTDIVPEGWTVDPDSTDPAGANFADGRVVHFEMTAAPMTITYELTPPADASGTASYDAGSRITVAGVAYPIEGDSTIEPAAPADPVPVIVTQPQSQTVDLGASVTFSVEAQSDTDVSYQWQRNGADIEGATGTSLTIDNAAAADAGDYRVLVTNEHGTTTSSVATLEVEIPPMLPVEITDLTIGSAETALLNASRIFGLAETYNYSVDVNGETQDVDVTLTHDARGRITGSGTMGESDVNVNGTVRRLGTGNDPIHRVNLVLRTADGATVLDQNLEVDVDGNRLVGQSRVRGEAEAQDVSVNLPVARTGDWSLDINSDADGQGTATLNLEDESIDYNVTAQESPAHNNRRVLDLTPAQANGAGGLRIDLDENDDVILVMGRAKGQTLNARSN